MSRRARGIWRNVVGQYECSGKTQEEFSAERQIPISTLRSWIYRLRREKEEEAGAILPVRVIGSGSPSASSAASKPAAVEVMLVHFDGGASTEFIAEVVSRLRRC